MENLIYYFVGAYLFYKLYQFVKKVHHLRFFSSSEWQIIQENLAKINLIFFSDSELIYPKDNINPTSPSKFDVLRFKNLIPLLTQLKELKKTSEILNIFEANKKFVPPSVRSKLQELKNIMIRVGEGSIMTALNDSGDIEFSVDYIKNQIRIRVTRSYNDEILPSWDSHWYIYTISLPISELGNAKVLTISRVYDAQHDYFNIKSYFFINNEVLLKNIMYHFSAYDYNPNNETSIGNITEKLEKYENLKGLIEKNIENFKIPKAIVMKSEELEKTGFPDD